MAVANWPVGGSPPPEDLGARFSQKREWLIWPPSNVNDAVYNLKICVSKHTSVEVDQGLLGDLGLDVTL